MRTQHLRKYKLLCGVAMCAMVINSMAPIAAVAAGAEPSGSNDGNTTTPIKHVIVIIGENRTFDHLFATYQPVNKGESVLNLLSEGIVNADGTPGPNYTNATQYQAMDTASDQKIYQHEPAQDWPIQYLAAAVGRRWIYERDPPFSNSRRGQTYENGLPSDYYKYLTTGGVPLPRWQAGHADLLRWPTTSTTFRRARTS